MADGSNYLGGPRHAPKPEFAPVPQSDPASPSGILNAAGRSRPRKGRAPGMASPQAVSSPLRLSSVGEIIGASKLGQRLPQQKTPGEQGSDAEEPNQAVESLPDGSFVHHRRMSNGTVNSNPIGSGRTLGDYPNLQHDSMPTTVGELQANLGVPDFFGEG